METLKVVCGSLALASACLSLSPSRAEVISAQPMGFAVEEHAHLAASPEQVWQALGHIGAWWIKEHTYSGDARNLSIGLRASDCFCERWAGGTVRHMVVVIAEPAKMLRLEGALGPLGGLGVSGHLTYSLKQAGAGTDLILTYDVGGWTKDGLAAFAAPVDAVLADQLNSLSRYVESKRP